MVTVFLTPLSDLLADERPLIWGLCLDPNQDMSLPQARDFCVIFNNVSFRFLSFPPPCALYLKRSQPYRL